MTAHRATVAAIFGALLSSCGGGGGGGASIVPPAPAGLRIFATDQIHNGDFLGDTTLTGQSAMEKADNFCQTDKNKPSSGTYKALLVDGMTRDALTPLDWVLKPNTAYYQADGVTRIATTTSTSIFPTTLEHFIHDSFGTSSDPNNPAPISIVWTGFADGSSFTAGVLTCSGWTYGGNNGDYAPYGVSYGTDGSEWYNNGGQVCSLKARLYCVEQ
jgi:hypothetical protein